MRIFKCKMCGGDLETNENMYVGTCTHCGTRQTLPNLDDDKKANLYDRANHFRLNNEYDKAMGIYEMILQEDKEDSEAYWSLVLCKYGIEYVEDPKTHKRIPTCNRTQSTSIYMDEDYKAALRYADENARQIYEQEAKRIDSIQRGILDIAQREDPFDVFLCYKETDSSGRRTRDSVLAQELYHQLKQEGFKVFFSRITLEDKLGSAYEPYIYAALKSSKVMVVIGTHPDHFNAVWVKNEWSRYLSMIKRGEEKVLIPAYKDMDPYDLPEEFSHLQAQDMSKLGFMQDLTRGIKKIISADDISKLDNKLKFNLSSENKSYEPLLDRAFLCLEDGDFKKADELLENVLNQNPRCAKAYVGKLMVNTKTRQEKDLSYCYIPLTDNVNFAKAIRFADEEYRNKLELYKQKVYENIELEKKSLYDKALEIKGDANTSSQYAEAVEIFESIPDYLDSKTQVEECKKLANEKGRLQSLYDKALDIKRNANTSFQYNEAAEIFESIPDYLNSMSQAQDCKKLAYEHYEMETKEKKHKKASNLALVGFILSIVSICFPFLVFLQLVGVVLCVAALIIGGVRNKFSLGFAISGLLIGLLTLFTFFMMIINSIA